MKQREPGKKKIRKLTEQDNLPTLFSDSKNRNPEKFADLFEDSFSKDTLENALKEKQPDACNRNQPVIKKAKTSPPPQDEIDLHGCTAHEAEVKVQSFILSAKNKGLHTVRIITGKGLHSQGKAILPELTETMMRLFKKENLITSFAWEKKSGNGSMLVSLS